MNDGRLAWVEEAYDLFGAASYSLAARILGPGEDAESTVVEAFQELVSLRESSQARFTRSLIFTATRTVAVRRLRRLRSLPELLTAPTALLKATAKWSGASTPDVELAICQRLTELDPAHRRILEKMYFADETMAEVGRGLHLAESEVRCALGAAMRELVDRS